MSSGPTTITDVARQAGVSISTVSRVLSNSAPVSDEKRSRVLEAVEELNYRPNILAQNLRRKSTTTIGVIVPTIRAPFCTEVFGGIENECFQTGRMVYLCDSDDDPEKEIIHSEQLMRVGVDGIIIVGAFGWEYQDHIETICKRGIPVSIINREVSNCSVDLILIDKTKGNYLATLHLIELGHRAIGCITNLSPGGTGHEEVKGYRTALNEAGIGVNENLIIETSPTFTGGFEAAKSLIQSRERLSAIFARSDTFAIGAARAITDLGLDIPEDLSLIGFGDIPVAEFYNPPLTTIRQPHFDMGVKAASMLFERIENKDLPQRQVFIEPRLIIRESTALYSGDDGE